ncbi:MAG: V-type ATPase subunit [Oscillospiraceae bacterium]|nr:V-type ATPase subunit [Oscillospiraceae bacterium]
MKAHDFISGNMIATVAKLHAISGKKLSKDDYAQLISCSTVADAAGYLKRRTYYARALDNVDTDRIHRGNLENILRRCFYEDYYRIANLEKVGDDEFYNYLVLKTEIDEILMCITHLNAGTDDHINTIPIYMNRYTSFDLTDLARVRSFDELLALIKGSPYADILKMFPPDDSGYIKYPECELALRTYYYRRLLKYADKTGDDEIRSFICSQIDMINIINAYRMKKHFGMSPETIKAAMIPIYLAVPEKKFDAMYEAKDMKGFAAELKKTVYGRDLSDQELESPEQPLQRLRLRQTKRAFSMAFSPPVVFFAFNTLADIEIKNIIRIIEGIRYSLPAEEIGRLIITE